MTKTLYDPEVEARGIQKGKIEDAKNFLKLGIDEEIVAKGTGIPLEKIIELKKELID